MKNTRKILERVPDGKFDYKPHPKSMTLGELATHLNPTRKIAAATDEDWPVIWTLKFAGATVFSMPRAS